MEEKTSKGLIFAGAGVAAAVLAGYLGLCGVAQASENILGDVNINGIEVGGMSKDQAANLVQEVLSQELHSITLTGSSWNGVLEGDIATAMVEDAIEEAYSLGRDTFLGSGLTYLSRKVGGDPTVSISLTLNDFGLDQFHSLLDEADASMSGGVVESVWEIDGDSLVITKGISGMSVDRAEAESATITALSSGGGSSVALNTNTTTPSDIDFASVRDMIYVEPISAQLDPETLTVSDHVMGVDLDVSVASTLYSSAAEGETFTVALDMSEPSQTSATLKASLFADVLGQGSSMLTGTAPRQANVALATEFCNDIIMMPGDVFSFYEKASPYSVANGYGVASAYVSGQVSSAVAGGICQVSSTLYYALLHTTLEIVDRRAHSMTVDYLPLGMDATVYSTQQDFQFKNNTEYPIKVVGQINARNGANYVDFTIYGTKTEDFTIKPYTNVSTSSSQMSYVASESTTPGSPKVVHSTYRSCSATVGRQYFDAAGNMIKDETLYTDRYSGSPSVTYYHPSDAASLGLPPVAGYTGTTEPEVTVPEETPAPDTTAPDTTAPDTTAPDTTAPDTTPAPEVTVPDTTPAPEASVPDTTPAPEAVTPDPTPAPEAVTPDPTPAPSEPADTAIPGV